MSKSKISIIRVQSSEGTKRIEIEPSYTILQLYDKVHSTFGLSGYSFALYRERNKKEELVSSRSRTLMSCGVKHGDLLYLAPTNGALLWTHEAEATTSNNKPSGEPAVEQDATPVSSVARQPRACLTEDDVDQQLWKLDGKIQRPRDEKLCRHGENACCVHCSPLEPFDDGYLKQQNIKHMSFHAYMRKLTAGADRGKFVSLGDISCRIKPGCKDHPPWPRGICSKCQPNAVTLNRQAYRHVDNVTFDNAHLVERFLNYWRSTGRQRIGFLYGGYEMHADVPLGIRATVAAIYEPPQESQQDSVTLLDDPSAAVADQLAAGLGLRKVGWIFTDLLADDTKAGTVKHNRNIDSHFLTADECIMAGRFQNEHPSHCRFSPVGHFGSKFATVCVTGDATNQVHMEGYEVSNQCMALVRDNIFVPTRDAPELGYIIESTDKQYVPDVYYKEKDSYGNEVPRLARPLPVEYLLVDVPASTPLTPIYTFHAGDNVRPFPVENRLVDGHVQDFSALSRYLEQFSPDQFLEAVSDFHFLLYIAQMEMLPMRDHLGPLLEAVRNKDSVAAREWSRSEHWATLEQLIAASGSSPPPSRPQSAVGGGSPLPLWTCPHCTFLNPADLPACDMCSLPRN